MVIEKISHFGHITTSGKYCTTMNHKYKPQLKSPVLQLLLNESDVRGPHTKPQMNFDGHFMWPLMSQMEK